MHFTNAIVALLASSSLVAALPGYSSDNKDAAKYGGNKDSGSKDSGSKDSGSKDGWKFLARGGGVGGDNKKEEAGGAKTPAPAAPAPAPAETVCSEKLETKQVEGMTQQVYEVTTTIFVPVTSVVEKVETNVQPVVITSYKTEVATKQETITTSAAQASVIKETKEVPVTSAVVETKTECATQAADAKKEGH